MAYDLPAGGKRLLQGPAATAPRSWSGQVTYRDGEPTGALPGRLVRGRAGMSSERTTEHAMDAGDGPARARAGGRVAGGRRGRSGGVDAAPDARRPRRARRRAGHGQGARAPTRSSSGARTSRSTAWRPSSTASSTSCSTAAASRASPPSTPTRYGDDDLTLLYWGIGLHLGEPWAQNKHGHVLGDVTDQGKTIDDPDRARQRARRHRARLPHRRVRPGRPALPAHGPHRRALLRGQRGGHPQPAGARAPGPGRRALRADALRHPGRAGRRARRPSTACRPSPSTPGGSSCASSRSTSWRRSAIPTRPG